MPRQTLSKVGKKPSSTKRSNQPYARIEWEKAKVLFDKPISTSKSSSYPSAKYILSVLAKVGAIGLIFAFPGAVPAIGSLFLNDKRYDTWKKKNIISRLAKSKLVNIKYGEAGKVIVAITKKGMIRALTYKLDTMQLKKPKVWDKKWRVVIFDIPEKWKPVREIFRLRLQQLGLYRLQDSVYVSPFKCFNEIEFLRELYGIAFTVSYLLVEKLEDDAFLKEHFDLA